MHIGILGDGRYAIWIWDTRQIIGSGKCDPTKVAGSPAKDNHKPLSGKNAEDFVFKNGSGQRATPETARYVVLQPNRLLFAGTSDSAIRAAKSVSAKYCAAHIVMLDKIELTDLKEYKGVHGFLAADSGRTVADVIVIQSSDDGQKLQKAKQQLDKGNCKPMPNLANNIAFAYDDYSSILFDGRDKDTYKRLRQIVRGQGRITTGRMFV